MGEPNEPIEVYCSGVPYTGPGRAVFARFQADVVEDLKEDFWRELAIDQNPCIWPVYQDNQNSEQVTVNHRVLSVHHKHLLLREG